jgi:hypothetical protein
MLRFLAGALLLCACAPVSKQTEPKRRYSDSIVVARDACIEDRMIKHRNPDGPTMYCGFEETVGSHVSRCICTTEDGSPADRSEAQQFLRDAVQMKQELKGG